MKELILFSLKNLAKHRRRNIFLFLSIAMSFSILLAFKGYITYTYWAMGQGSIIGKRLGHLQIYKKGYYEKGEIEPGRYIISDKEQKEIYNILKTIPDIHTVSFRISVQGLFSNGNLSGFFVSDAGNPELERNIKNEFEFVEGSALEKDSFEITIGKRMSEIYNIHTGDTLTLLTNTYNGFPNAIDVSVKGIFQSGYREVDTMVIEMSLQSAQKLLSTNSVEKIVILLNQTGKVLEWHDERLLRFQKKLEKNLSYLDIEIKNWMDLSPDYKLVKGLYDTLFFIIQCFTFSLVIFFSGTIILISVLERTREIGTFRAMGLTLQQIYIIFFLEGFFIGIIGNIMGMIIGTGLIFFFNLSRFHWKPPGSNIEYPVLIFSQFEHYFIIFFLILLCTVLSSLIALIKISRMNVIECIRSL